MSEIKNCECDGMALLSRLGSYGVWFDDNGLCYLKDALCKHCIFCGGCLALPGCAAGLSHPLGKAVMELGTIERVIAEYGPPDDIITFEQLLARNPVMQARKSVLEADWNRLIRYRNRFDVSALDVYEMLNGSLEVHIVD